MNEFDPFPESSREARIQAWYLIRHGWSFELPDVPDPYVWQWYWRRPSRRPGKSGRRYLSTNQAYNALMRELS